MAVETATALIFGLIVLGGVAIIIAGMRHRARILEMAHRERLAMIERGLTPPADLTSAYQARPAARSNRLLSFGIVIVGLGLGLAMLIGFASREPEIAVGVGGAIVVLGAAFIVTALVVHGPGKQLEDSYGSLSRSSFDRPAPPPPLNHRDPPLS
jgi:uncharacterized protein DUF6249